MIDNVVFATDIHGSLAAARKVIEAYEREKAELLILLGDLYYHGPRNPLPTEYAPMEVAQLFNSYADKLCVVRGNCDAEVDLTISEFQFQNEARLEIGGFRVTALHGDMYNPNLPPIGCDAVVYGHTHENGLFIRNGVLSINLSSASLPKNSFTPCYLVLNKGVFYRKNFQGDILEAIALKK